MKPYGLLMVEHRLIEKMLALLTKALGKSEIDLVFVEASIDFFRTYADRTHHGKEEDILFKELSAKNIPQKMKDIIASLIADHATARKHIAAMDAAKDRYEAGDLKAADEIRNIMRALLALYPPHIAKEDKEFFIPSMDYLTPAEQEKMLQEFYDFDRQMIHEKYRKVIEGLEKR